MQQDMAAANRTFGQRDYRTATTLNELAQLFLKQHRFSEAEDYLRKATAMQELALGPDNPYVANSLSNLGQVYREEHRYDEAVSNFSRAITIWQHALGKQHPNIADGLSNLAAAHVGQQKLGQALEESGRAVAILAQHFAHLGNSQTVEALQDENQYHGDILANIEISYLVGKAQPERRPALDAAAFETAQLMQQSRAGLAMTNMAARAGSGRADLQELLRAQQDATAESRQLESALVNAASCPPGQCDPRAAQQLRDAQGTVSQRIDQLNAIIGKEFPEYAELMDPQPLTAAAAQALLAT